MRHLRIFYASDTTPNAWFQSVRSNIWRNNLFLPLVDLGHDVVEFDYDLTQTFRNLDPADAKQAAFIAGNRPKVTGALLQQLRAAHARKRVDVLFTYYTDACIEAGALDEIRAMGIVTVNWYCNGSYQMRLVQEIAPRYDWCLVPEKFRLADYRAMGARPIYCQEAANPNVYKPYDVAREFDVTFIGQAYGERPLFIRDLFEHGIEVHVWGHGWRNPNPKYVPKETYEAILGIPEEYRNDPLSDEELVRTYSRSKINLGFSTCGDTHLSTERIVQVRLRDFEVPMSGGFYVVERIDELAEFFVPGKEIICYTGATELRESIRYYLAHDREREAIRVAGHERALRDHTWQKRFSCAFEQMAFG